MNPHAAAKPKVQAKPKANGKSKAARPKVSAVRPSAARTLTVASPPRAPGEDQYGVLAGLIR